MDSSDTLSCSERLRCRHKSCCSASWSASPPSSSHVLRRQARVACRSPHCKGLARPRLSRSGIISALLAPKIALDDFRGTIDLPAQAFDRLCYQNDLFTCLIPVSLFNRFTNPRKSFDAIACVESGSIDLVLEPRSSREAVGSRQCPFTTKQDSVQGFLG